MKHYYNRRSGKTFCQLKGKPQSSDYSVCGQALGAGTGEPWCLRCVQTKDAVFGAALHRLKAVLPMGGKLQ